MTAELTDFLNTADAFQEFVPIYTSLVDRMREAAQSVELEWDDVINSAFIQLQREFKRNPKKNFPDMSLSGHPLIVTPIVFGNAVSAILEQEKSDLAEPKGEDQQTLS